ncbi:MAG: quinoprotein dehydrogenase-associated SoxYZ-like carrier [Hyphomicrobiaceae bacterium]
MNKNTDKKPVDIHTYVTVLGMLLLAFALFASPTTALADDANASDQELWQSIKEDLFDDRAIAKEDGNVMLEAPYRAQDAALVPLTITIPARISRNVKNLTLVIDKNPAPVAAKFSFGEAAGVGTRKISTRVRIDMYSDVRAIIETHDGKLHMATKFVKAAGGCSAPALKDLDQAMANLGKMKLRWVKNAATNANAEPSKNQSSRMAEAQVMIKHPNYSGMQMNQLTGLYIPAKFVEKLAVYKGDRLIFDMVGGISISENPNLHFTYEAGASEPLHVSATDTQGNTFKIEAQPKSS